MPYLILAALTALIASPAPAETGLAKIKGTAEGSAISGAAELRDTKEGLEITVKVEGLPPGEHGIHIHELGLCDEAGKAAASHFNPLGTKHGDVQREGLKKAHAGDFGNLSAGPDGRAVLGVRLKRVKLAKGKLTVAGRAIIIHEKNDDFGQPAGNAGGRIACGVIVVSGP